MIHDDQHEIGRILPLLKAVLDKESDEFVWDAVYSALTECTPSPRSSTIQQTVNISLASACVVFSWSSILVRSNTMQGGIMLMSRWALSHSLPGKQQYQRTVFKRAETTSFGSRLSSYLKLNSYAFELHHAIQFSLLFSSRNG